MRNVEDRLRWYVSHRPTGAGRCAEYLMQSLDVPPQGFPDATAVARKVQSLGKMFQGPAPRGAIHYWDRGSEGHGHVAYEYNEHGDVASVDVAGPASVGIRPFPWFNQNWPSLRYLGWSWWWGGIDTKEVVMPPDPYIMKKVETDQIIPLNTWMKADLGKVDQVQPPYGADDWDFYINLDLKRLAGAGRNDLRYILGRWARHDTTSTDLNEQGLDVTGADTKAIPMDLPKATLRYTWTHGFKGEAGVPVSFWLYIGSMQNGSIVSPLRIFKVDDES